MISRSTFPDASFTKLNRAGLMREKNVVSDSGTAKILRLASGLHRELIAFARDVDRYTTG